MSPLDDSLDQQIQDSLNVHGLKSEIIKSTYAEEYIQRAFNDASHVTRTYVRLGRFEEKHDGKITTGVGALALGLAAATKSIEIGAGASFLTSLFLTRASNKTAAFMESVRQKLQQDYESGDLTRRFEAEIIPRLKSRAKEKAIAYFEENPGTKEFRPEFSWRILPHLLYPKLDRGDRERSKKYGG